MKKSINTLNCHSRPDGKSISFSAKAFRMTNLSVLALLVGMFSSEALSLGRDTTVSVYHLCSFLNYLSLFHLN